MNLKEKIDEFFSTMSQMTADFINGEKIRADRDVYEKRLGICNDCEMFNKGKCTECGCNMILKCGINSAKCPKGKW